MGFENMMANPPQEKEPEENQRETREEVSLNLRDKMTRLLVMGSILVGGMSEAHSAERNTEVGESTRIQAEINDLEDQIKELKQEEAEKLENELTERRNEILSNFGSGLSIGERGGDGAFERGLEYIGIYKDGEHIGNVEGSGFGRISDDEFAGQVEELLAGSERSEAEEIETIMTEVEEALSKSDIEFEKAENFNYQEFIDEEARALLEHWEGWIAGNEIFLPNDPVLAGEIVPAEEIERRLLGKRPEGTLLQIYEDSTEKVIVHKLGEEQIVIMVENIDLPKDLFVYPHPDAGETGYKHWQIEK